MNLWNKLHGDNTIKRLTMLIALPLYIYYVAIHTLIFLHHDGELFKARTRLDMCSFLFNKRTGLLRKSFIPWLDIFKKDFHPLDHDHTQLLLIPKITVDNATSFR